MAAYMLHICCHCTTVRDVCPSSSTSSSATLNHSAFTCQGLSINRAPACARQLPPGNTVLNIATYLVQFHAFLFVTCPHSLHGLAPAGVRRFIRQLAAHATAHSL